MEKIVLITRPTRLDALIEKFNTKPQAKFYIEHLGADFTDYEEEHDTYYRELDALKSVVQEFGHMQVLDWKHLSNYIFGAKDLVITIGQDGLVANTLKYLDQQLLIGFNSDFDRWDGILSRFHTGQARDVITRALRHRAKVYGVTKAKVELSDQQVLYAVNDFFIGVNNHSSARYEISYGGKRENQSSSGVIVSTPLGSSGWMRSILRGAKGISQSIDDTKGSWRDSAKQLRVMGEEETALKPNSNAMRSYSAKTSGCTYSVTG